MSDINVIPDRERGVVVGYLTKFGYVVKKEDLSESELKELRSSLMARPLRDEKFGKAEDVDYPVYVETKNKMYIPKMYGITHFGVPKLMSKEYLGKKWDGPCKFVGTLQNSQIEPVDKLLKGCREVGGGILSLGTGGGKTFCALKVISELCCKTLIVVNKITLMKQWEYEINKFLPDANVGFIQGQKNVNVNDCHIVIAMMQSVTKIDYPQELFNDFSVVVIDEIHNVCSKSFSKIFFKLTSRYTIGLSATPHRSDGCEYVFKWHVGDIVYQTAPQAVRPGLSPIIRSVVLNSNSEYQEIKIGNSYNDEERLQFTSMISQLIEIPKRNKLIIEMIKKVINNKNRKILLLSDRRSHLTELKSLLDKDVKVTFTYGLFLGSMKIADLERSKSCSLILATYKAFSEGVSEASLNTLILTTPKKFTGHLDNTSGNGGKKDSGQLNQIVGRIFRKQHTDIHPTIIDLQDNFSVYRNQSKQRNIFYKGHFRNGIFKTSFYNLDAFEIDEIRADFLNERTQQVVDEVPEKIEQDALFGSCMID